jgi:hypothetical protein
MYHQYKHLIIVLSVKLKILFATDPVLNFCTHLLARRLMLKTHLESTIFLSPGLPIICKVYYPQKYPYQPRW